MANSSRLDRLKKLVTSDLEALPDRPASAIDDEAGSGGVSLVSGDSCSTAEKPSSPEPTRQATKDQETASPNDLNPALSRLSLATSEPQHVANPERRYIHIQSEAQSEPETDPERRFVLVHGAQSSWNNSPGSTTAIHRLPPAKLERGSLAPRGQAFCPVLAISRFPYKFANPKDSQRIASRFFDEGKFWLREWDLFYVWGVDGAKPLILITEQQVQALLNDINREYRDIGVRITAQHRADGLVAKFPNHPRLTPRYLGRTSSRYEYEKMSNSAPGFKHVFPGEAKAPPPDERSLEAFKQMYEDALELNKARNKAKAAKKREERVFKQQNMGKQLKRAQRYLGLRPKKEDSPDPVHDPNLSWQELKQAQQVRDEKKVIYPIDPELPVPHSFDSSVVFICVDIEAYEKNHRQITEVGISTLDTRDLADIAPGKDGINWTSKIRTRHFRIREHGHLSNSEFVQGCAHRFEHGDSEWVSLSDATSVIASCFRPPFPSPFLDSELPSSWKGSKSEERKIVLLGHDTNNDILYLQQLGYNPLNLVNLVEVLDTAVIYRAWKREPNPRSLNGILYDFDIPGWNLHNAGNDAFYTTQAMLAVCVREATIRGSKEVKQQREEEKQSKILEATKEAATRAQEDAEGWSSSEEGDDGGAPVPTVIKEKVEIANAPTKSFTPVANYLNGSPAQHGLSPFHNAERGGRSGFADAHRARGTFLNGAFFSGSDARGRGRGGRGRAAENFSGQRGGSFGARGRGRNKGRGRGVSHSDDESRQGYGQAKWRVGVDEGEQGELVGL